MKCPSKKKGYKTQLEAEEQLWYIRFFGIAWRKEDRTYLCPLCQRWHLTSQEKRKKEEAK